MQQYQQPSPAMYNSGYDQYPVGSSMHSTPVFVVSSPPPSPVRYADYNSNASTISGIILIVAGVISIAGQCILIREYAEYVGVAFIGVGIWFGIACIIAGCFGISAGRARTKCMVVAFTVLSIITAAISAYQIVISSKAIAIMDKAERLMNYEFEYEKYSTDIERKVIAMCAMLLASGVIGGIASIVGSAFACKVACCCSNPRVEQYHMGQNDVPCLDPGQPNVVSYPSANVGYVQDQAMSVPPPSYK